MYRGNRPNPTRLRSARTLEVERRLLAGEAQRDIGLLFPELTRQRIQQLAARIGVSGHRETTAQRVFRTQRAAERAAWDAEVQAWRDGRRRTLEVRAAKIAELRDAGWGFKRIGSVLGMSTANACHILRLVYPERRTRPYRSRSNGAGNHTQTEETP